MGIPILILGESGTGKTTSLRNFKNDEVAFINVAGKPLPFKGKFDGVSGTTEFRKIYTFLKTTQAKTIVIDDAQYIMSFQYMRRIKENGWDKFNELQSDFFALIDCVKDLPSDTVVYFLSHIETKEDGRQKIKTIGKMLDEKITIEGMFTVVLKTYVADGKYYFLTQNSGSDTVKSPIGMFPSYAIDNDLKYVDEKIRNYYELGKFLSDEEMAEIDKEAAQLDIFKDEVEGKKRRSARGRKQEESADKADTAEDKQPTEATTEDAEPKKQRTRRRPALQPGDAVSSSMDIPDGTDEKPLDESTDLPERKQRESVDEQESQSNAATETVQTEEKYAEESTGENNSTGEEAAAPAMNPPESEEPAEEQADASPRRRRRRV